MRVAGVWNRLWRRGPERVPMLDGYARWAPTYPPRPHNPLMATEAAVVGPMLMMAAPRRALDVGTGTGRNVDLLTAAGARTIVGIDLSASMLSRWTHRAARVLGDARSLPFASGAFDVVCASLMCGDVPDLGAWIGEASRVLGRGGHLVYSDFHPSWSSEGWRRTFTGADGREYELPLHAHGIEQHLDLLAANDLDVRTIREPKIPGGHTPVVVVLHAIKLQRTR